MKQTSSLSAALFIQASERKLRITNEKLHRLQMPLLIVLIVSILQKTSGFIKSCEGSLSLDESVFSFVPCLFLVGVGRYERVDVIKVELRNVHSHTNCLQMEKLRKLGTVRSFKDGEDSTSILYPLYSYFFRLALLNWFYFLNFCNDSIQQCSA